MANNRMYCVCVKCKQAAFLSKHFGTGFSSSTIDFETLEGFLDAHQYCDGAVTLKYELSDHGEELDEGAYQIFINGDQKRFVNKKE